MPIYEYRCTSCQHTLEVIQKISDDRLVDCPSCKEPALKKQVTAAGFRLKGSGWYETDFKTGKKKNLEGSTGDNNAATKSDKSAAESASSSTSTANATS